MISAWEVYLFMQISNIAFATILISIWFILGACIHAMIIESEYGVEHKDYSRPKRFVKIGVVVFFVGILIPTRETIAAMYIVPKLTSKEFIVPVTKEAKELYDLFKESLRDKK